jgi:hypothetical protein
MYLYFADTPRSSSYLPYIFCSQMTIEDNNKNSTSYNIVIS